MDMGYISPVDEGIMAVAVFMILGGIVGSENVLKPSFIPALSWTELGIVIFIVSFIIVLVTKWVY